MGIELRLILEILGRPADHIVNTLKELVDRLGKEKGVKIVVHKVHDPVPVKDAKDLFTTFAEVELEVDSLTTYMMVLFTYMPSNVEIISPERFNLANQEMSSLGTLVLNKLHFYESITKRLVAERDILVNRLQAHEKKPGKPEKTKIKKKSRKKH